ncbi:MAG: nitrilase-related carbon-nitrogen hydrolase, partial [Janthinobacterium lividum]
MSSPAGRTTTTTITVVADEFGRDLEAAYATIGRIVTEAAARGTDLLVLPEACLGGYLPSLGSVDDDEETRARRRRNLPPAFHVDGPEVARL